MLLREEKKGVLQSSQTDDDFVNFLAHVEAKVERDLIVAAAGGVQFCPGRPDPFRQRRLDVHMHIFERLIPNEFAVRDFSFDLAQSARDHLELVSRENSGGSESGGMRD